MGVRAEAESVHVIEWDVLIEKGGEMPEIMVDPDSDACIFYTSERLADPKAHNLLIEDVWLMP